MLWLHLYRAVTDIFSFDCALNDPVEALSYRQAWPQLAC